MGLQAFLDRIKRRLPARPPAKYEFFAWNHANQPTKEGFGIMPIPGVVPEKVIDAVLDVDHYVGNIEHVAACRSIPDSRFEAPNKVRFYQKLDIPLIGSVHHELVLERLGEQEGYHVAGWEILRTETDALSKRDGFRSDYSNGAWLAAPGVLGYALSSAPQRKDVGFIKWKVLTSGADVAASSVIKANLESMARWAARR